MVIQSNSNYTTEEYLNSLNMSPTMETKERWKLCLKCLYSMGDPTSTNLKTGQVKTEGPREKYFKTVRVSGQK